MPHEKAALPVIVLTALVVASVLFLPAAQKFALNDDVKIERVAPLFRHILLVFTFMATAMTVALL